MDEGESPRPARKENKMKKVISLLLDTLLRNLACRLRQYRC